MNTLNWASIWNYQNTRLQKINRIAQLIIVFIFLILLKHDLFQARQNHSALFEFFQKLRSDRESNFMEYILQLCLQCSSLSIELIDLLLQFQILLQNLPMLLKQDSVFLLLSFDMFFPLSVHQSTIIINLSMRQPNLYFNKGVLNLQLLQNGEMKVEGKGQLGCICWILQQIQVMSSKRSSYSVKDHSKVKEKIIPRLGQDRESQKVRILQDNLVFVNGMPTDTFPREQLEEKTLFGRYGPVQKLIITPHPSKKSTLCQAYVTYTSQIEAALAIVALDGYRIQGRPLKASFGTTKYCSYFLRGQNCPNEECFYLHDLEKGKQVSSSESKTVFKDQSNKAVKIVKEGLNEIVKKIVQTEQIDVEEGFPSITQTLNYLVDEGMIDEKELDSAYEQANKQGQNYVVMPNLDNRCLSQPNQKEPQKQIPKLVKSNSLSTMGTPSKPNSLQQATPQTQNYQRLILELKQNIVQQQKGPSCRELQLQQKIQKLIIKQIFRKANSECRSRFIKSAVATREDIAQLRTIVQACLITRN